MIVMEKRNESLLEEHMKSLASIEEAGTDDFFYTRLRARMDNDEASSSLKGWAFPFRPAFEETVRYSQRPSMVGVKRTWKELPPSQKPLTSLVEPSGPWNVAVTAALESMYQLRDSPLAVRCNS